MTANTQLHIIHGRVIGQHYPAASIVVLFARQSGRHFTFHDAKARADRSLLATAFLQHQNTTTLPSMPILLLHAQWRNCLYLGVGARPSSGGGGGEQEDGIAMIFSHHMYCAQSKVKWGTHGGGGGHSYATVHAVCYRFLYYSTAYRISKISYHFQKEKGEKEALNNVRFKSILIQLI